MIEIIIKNQQQLGDSFNTIREEFERLGEVVLTIDKLESLEKHRSNQQNRLSFLWYKEASDQLKDYDVDGYRALCKLRIGVAIRKEKPKFRIVYDRVIKPLTYEQKIACMMEPINFPITSEMGVKEMARYLEGVELFLTEAGVVLSKPDDIYYNAMGLKKEK
jgi:hypothetical protein